MSIQSSIFSLVTIKLINTDERSNLELLITIYHLSFFPSTLFYRKEGKKLYLKNRKKKTRKIKEEKRWWGK